MENNPFFLVKAFTYSQLNLILNVTGINRQDCRDGEAVEMMGTVQAALPSGSTLKGESRDGMAAGEGHGLMEDFMISKLIFMGLLCGLLSRGKGGTGNLPEHLARVPFQSLEQSSFLPRATKQAGVRLECPSLVAYMFQPSPLSGWSLQGAFS